MLVKDVLSVATGKVSIWDLDNLTEIAHGNSSELCLIDNKILNAKVLSLSGDIDYNMYRIYGGIVKVITVYVNI